MKRRLNLNGVGGRIMLAGSVLVSLVPMVLYAASLVLDRLGASGRGLFLYIRVSALAGGSLLAALVLMLAVELVQDALFDRWYRRQRRHKLNLPDGGYECQYCGNRQVTGGERYCRVCGKELV